MPTVLLTRPETDSQRVALKLESRGYDVIIEPLLTIDAVLASMPKSDAWVGTILTSANALVAMGERKSEFGSLLTLPCFCVGSQTAAAARRFGFSTVRDAEGDGHRLAELISRSPQDKKGELLYMSGVDKEPTLENALKDADIAFHSWVVYKAIAKSHLSEGLQKLLAAHKIDAVLLFSARTALTLRALLKKYDLEACCSLMTAIGIGASVQVALNALAWQHVAIASQPTEEAVLAMLQKFVPSHEVP